MNVSSVAEGSPVFGSLLRRLLVVDLQVKRAAKESGCRTVTVRRRNNHNSTRSSSNNEARLQGRSTDRGKANRKVESGDSQKKRRHQDRDNSDTITRTAPERENSATALL